MPAGAPESTQHPYLLLFYNNYDHSYTSRDPYFLSIGWEVLDGEGGNNNTPSILWAQPEVVLYDRVDHTDRPGYPDFVQDYEPASSSSAPSAGGGDASADVDVWTVFITETQKTAARLHKVDAGLIQGLLQQHFASSMPSGDVVMLAPGECVISLTCSMRCVLSILAG